MSDAIQAMTNEYAAALVGTVFPTGYYAVIALLALFPENEGYKLNFQHVKTLLEGAGFTAQRKGNLVEAVYASDNYGLTLFSYRSGSALEILFGDPVDSSRRIGLATLARHLQLQENPDHDPLYPRFEVKSEEGLRAAINYLTQIAV